MTAASNVLPIAGAPRPRRASDTGRSLDAIRFAGHAISDNSATASRLPDTAPAADTLTRGLVEVLNWLEHGVMLVDETARVLFMSTPAREVIESGRLRLTQGVLRSQSAAETLALHRMIARCAHHDGAADALPTPSLMGDPPLTVVVAPFRAASPDTSRAILFVVDPSRMAPPTTRQLRDQFGLTVAQAAFAVEVIKGEGLKACADRLGISQTTARTHLNHVFVKTGTRRQAELVHTIFASRLPVRELR